MDTYAPLAAVEYSNWPGVWNFSINGSGNQVCGIDGVVEATPAKAAGRDRLLDHYNHAVSAHAALIATGQPR